MLRSFTIAQRIAFLIIGGIGVLFLTVGAIGTSLSARGLEKELEKKASAIATAVSNRIDLIQESVEKTALGLVIALESGTIPEEKWESLLSDTVRRQPAVFGSALAMDPALGRSWAPYAFGHEGQISVKDLAVNGYAYQTWDWFQLPRELTEPVWTEPYFDEGGGDILMTTYSSPLMRSGTRNGFWGVVTCDLSLRWLSDFISSLDLGKTGYAFVVSSEGTIVSHPTRAFIMHESVFSLAEEKQSASLRALGRRMIHGKSGFERFETFTQHRDAYIAYAPAGPPGWSVGVVFLRKDITGPVLNLVKLQGATGAAGFLMLLGLALVIARSITRPVKQLEAAARRLATGDLTTEVPEFFGEDEISHLARSFARMQTDLKVHIESLKETTAAKERIEKELQIARQIQMSLVPKTFPPFPSRHDLDLYAILDPAREVGGDFFDFFPLKDARLCLLIGDVSGKGVPAALYMAATRALLRSLFRLQQRPAEVLSALNGELAEEKGVSMFVTIFCAVVDLATGHVRYASGGHNPPYILRLDGTLETVPPLPGLVVGAMPGIRFSEGEFTLTPGDTLFLFTDGVTEALNNREEFFGEEGTEEAIRAYGTCGTCEGLISSVRNKIRVFAGDAEQSDDITMLAFRRLGVADGPKVTS